MKMNINIKTKILLLIIPLLLSCFLISGTVSIETSRKNLILISSEFMHYKLDQVCQYAAGQWVNLTSNGLEGNDVYRRFTEESIAGFATGTISGPEEIIIAADSSGETIFCTREDMGVGCAGIEPVPIDTYLKSSLNEYDIGGVAYLGIQRSVSGLGWDFFFLQEKRGFTSEIRHMTNYQIITFSLAFVVIILGLVLTLNAIINPINRVNTAIKNIMASREFTHTVPITSSDELGKLASDFNNMITSLDLAHRKMKKYAVDEAVAQKQVFLREIETLDLLGRASDYKDSDTGNHTRRVSGYSRVIAEGIGLSDEYIDLLYYASPLHDIGKLGIPDSILLKEGQLTREERETIQTHTTLGYQILEDFSSKYLKAGAVIAYSHHERFDGAGYPRGKEGSEIPQFGRIVSIADVFDALTTKRPYKKAWAIKDALELIESEKGAQFDPALVDAFLEKRREILDIFEKTKEL